jgi:hypothetical protein
MSTTTVDDATREGERSDTLNDRVRHAIIFCEALKGSLGEILRLLEEAKTGGGEKP